MTLEALVPDERELPLELPLEYDEPDPPLE
jgi:hypothetical protein